MLPSDTKCFIDSAPHPMLCGRHTIASPVGRRHAPHPRSTLPWGPSAAPDPHVHPTMGPLGKPDPHVHPTMGPLGKPDPHVHPTMGPLGKPDPHGPVRGRGGGDGAPPIFVVHGSPKGHAYLRWVHRLPTITGARRIFTKFVADVNGTMRRLT